MYEICNSVVVYYILGVQIFQKYYTGKTQKNVKIKKVGGEI